MVFTTLSTSNNKQRAFVTRDLTLLRRNTASLISMFVVPPLFLLCLVAVFGYSSDKIGFDYVGFILAGCLFQAAMFTAAASSMAVAIDIDAGLVERVRVLPGSVGGHTHGWFYSHTFWHRLAMRIKYDMGKSRLDHIMVHDYCLRAIISHRRLRPMGPSTSRTSISHSIIRNAATYVLHCIHSCNLSVRNTP